MFCHCKPLVQLHSGFDEPNWIGECARDKTGTCRRNHMDVWSVGCDLAIAKRFYLRVCAKVDGSERYTKIWVLKTQTSNCCYLEGATPMIFGARPLNNPLGPSVWMICWIHREMLRLLFICVSSRTAASSADKCTLWPKVATDDWRRVLTTSSGHVITAPNVPPRLNYK